MLQPSSISKLPARERTSRPLSSKKRKTNQEKKEELDEEKRRTKEKQTRPVRPKHGGAPEMSNVRRERAASSS